MQPREPFVKSRNRRQAERTGLATAGLRTEGPHGNHKNEIPTAQMSAKANSAPQPPAKS